MKRRLLAVVLTMALAVASLAGCGGDKTSTSASTGNTGTETSTSGNSSETSGETITIDVFDAAANYQGMQTGWFQEVVKSRFNIELNILAPQVSGDALYQTRVSSGNLGDIVLLDATDFADCVKAGLIKDISAEFKNSENLMKFQDQIDTYNKSLEGNAEGKTYGIPTEMMNTSPTSFSDDVIYSSPLLRWDLYQAVGAPDIADLNGLLDVLAEMMEKYPTNEAGDPCYPLSLWKDWDGGDGMLGIANVVQLTTWYGEKIKGSAILKADNTFTPITDKTATYYKLLKFLNDAYQRGLVDPDSATQDWNSACAKMTAGQVYLMWYSWQVGFWNTNDRLANGTAFIFTPVKDQIYYTNSDTYYGSGRLFGVGAGVEGEKYDRIMKFLDWYASPEGCQFQHAGIEGFNYTVNEDGTFTQINDNALMDNLPVPAEYGGAGYQDGNNAINQWIVSAAAFNPNTKEQYAAAHWSSYKAATMTKTKTEWAERFGAAEPVDWMKANNALLVSPSVSVNLASDTADISVIRNQCNQELCDASWRMIFANSNEEFDAMWDELATNLDSFGFQDLYKFDVDNYTVELNAKLDAMK